MVTARGSAADASGDAGSNGSVSPSLSEIRRRVNPRRVTSLREARAVDVRGAATPATARKACFHWLHSSCRFGSSCQFLHPAGLEGADADDRTDAGDADPASSPSARACPHFKRGFCLYGDSCRFAHSTGMSEGARRVAEVTMRLQASATGDAGGGGGRTGGEPEGAGAGGAGGNERIEALRKSGSGGLEAAAASEEPRVAAEQTPASPFGGAADPRDVSGAASAPAAAFSAPRAPLAIPAALVSSVTPGFGAHPVPTPVPAPAAAPGPASIPAPVPEVSLDAPAPASPDIAPGPASPVARSAPVAAAIIDDDEEEEAGGEMGCGGETRSSLAPGGPGSGFDGPPQAGAGAGAASGARRPSAPAFPVPPRLSDEPLTAAHQGFARPGGGRTGGQGPGPSFAEAAELREGHTGAAVPHPSGAEPPRGPSLGASTSSLPPGALPSQASLTCEICETPVLLRSAPSDRVFGVLRCPHVFCHDCISGWRETLLEAGDAQEAESCPACGEPSEAVGKSVVWPERAEDRAHLVRAAALGHAAGLHGEELVRGGGEEQSRRQGRVEQEAEAGGDGSAAAPLDGAAAAAAAAARHSAAPPAPPSAAARFAGQSGGPSIAGLVAERIRSNQAAWDAADAEAEAQAEARTLAATQAAPSARRFSVSAAAFTPALARDQQGGGNPGDATTLAEHAGDGGNVHGGEYAGEGGYAEQDGYEAGRGAGGWQGEEEGEEENAGDYEGGYGGDDDYDQAVAHAAEAAGGGAGVVPQGAPPPPFLPASAMLPTGSHALQFSIPSAPLSRPAHLCAPRPPVDTSLPVVGPTPHLVITDLPSGANARQGQGHAVLAPSGSGSLCPHCHRVDLSSMRPTVAAAHVAECRARHDRLTRAVESLELECSICLEPVLQKQPISARKFGLLSCNHVFCFACISEWRKTGGDRAFSFGPEALDVARGCPTCRAHTDVVTPSAVWPRTPEEKEAIIKRHRERLASIDCRHFDFGRGSCPFGTSCLYRHAYPNGQLQDRNVRFLLGSDEDYQVVREPTLADFITVTNRRSRPRGRRGRQTQ